MNHIFSGYRCIFCNIEKLDSEIYEEYSQCEERDTFTYTTETGDKGPTDYRFKEQYDAFGFKLDLSNVQEGYNLFDDFHGKNV